MLIVVRVYDMNAVGGVGKRGWGMAVCRATVADGESPGQCQAVLAPLRQTAARAPGDTAGGADASARQSASVGGGRRRVLSSGLRQRDYGLARYEGGEMRVVVRVRVWVWVREPSTYELCVKMKVGPRRARFACAGKNINVGLARFQSKHAQMIIIILIIIIVVKNKNIKTRFFYHSQAHSALQNIHTYLIFTK